MNSVATSGEQEQGKIFAPEYKANKELIASAREQGNARLRLPEKLETSFIEHFSTLSLNTFHSVFLYLVVPFLLFVHLGLFELGLLQGEQDSANGLLKEAIGTKGIKAVLINHMILAGFLVLFWFAPKINLIKHHFQLFLCLTSPIILALATLNLALVNDPKYLFTLQLELVFYFLFVFCLIQLQFKLLIISTVITGLYFLLGLSFLVLQPDWSSFITEILSLLLFGFIFAYLREYRERNRYLTQLEIENEKLQLEFLHIQIEKENNLKAELSRFYSVMSGEKDIYILGEKILSFMTPELNANVSSLYLAHDEKLALISQYGLSAETEAREVIELGAGLVGQCATEKNMILINESPENFQVIQSGLGKIHSPALSIFPMLLDNEVIAVMEIASIKPLEKEAVEFIEAANRSIAIALKAVSAKSSIKA